jgi:hypothetical protein
MDPYLEHPALWQDIHNRLITAVADVLSPILDPRYYVGIESRMVVVLPGDTRPIGRTDVGVMLGHGPQTLSPLPLAEVDVVEVELPMRDEAQETFLEVRETRTSKLITTLEILSPYNKRQGEGRSEYLGKREYVLGTFTNLVEIDLLRAGEPLPYTGQQVQSDYRILIARGLQRPRAQLYAFNLRQPIPSFPLPLLSGDHEPLVDLNTILHDLYVRARFYLRLDYTQPPVPPLSEADSAWARTLITPAH